MYTDTFIQCIQTHSLFLKTEIICKLKRTCHSMAHTSVILRILRGARLSSPGQLHPFFSQSTVHLHNNEPAKEGMTSSLCGPCCFTQHPPCFVQMTGAGCAPLIPSGVRGWAGPAAVEQTSVPPHLKKKKKAQKQKVRKPDLLWLKHWCFSPRAFHLLCSLPWQWTLFL